MGPDVGQVLLQVLVLSSCIATPDNGHLASQLQICHNDMIKKLSKNYQ